MNAPSFEFSRGIAVLTWEDPGSTVRMEFRRCQQDRKTADVSAELLVYVDLGVGEIPLHRTRLNLTATRTRQEVANYLGKRMDGPDWAGMLGEAAWAVTDAVREGEPAILLRDAVPPPAGGAILPPLLTAPDPVILFGDGGTAKSYLGLAVAVSLHTDRPLCGLKPTQKLRTALLDFEWTAWPHQKRLRRLWGPGTPPDVVYVPCMTAGPLSTQVDRLRRILREHDVEYVVVDSVALACAGPPEESGVALDFFQSLRQLEVGALLIAHVNRNADTWKPFGSSFWHNSARATWFIEREQSEELRLTLRNRKVNDGKLMPPVGLTFAFKDGETTEIERVEVREERFKGTSLLGDIRQALQQQQPQTYAGVAGALRTSPDTVRKAVERNPADFRIERRPGLPSAISLRPSEEGRTGGVGQEVGHEPRTRSDTGQQADILELGTEGRTHTSDKSDRGSDGRGGVSIDPPSVRGVRPEGGEGGVGEGHRQGPFDLENPRRQSRTGHWRAGRWVPEEGGP